MLTDQQQIVELLRAIQQKHDLTYVFISHDLSIVRALCDYVMVMQRGRVVEEGTTAQIFDAPQHGYTKDLIRAAFDLSDLLRTRRQQMAQLSGASV